MNDFAKAFSGNLDKSVFLNKERNEKSGRELLEALGKKENKAKNIDEEISEMEETLKKLKDRRADERFNAALDALMLKLKEIREGTSNRHARAHMALTTFSEDAFS